MKTAILISIGVSALVGLVALLDMVMGLVGQPGLAPFSGQTTMDIMFVVSAGLIGWMGMESLREQN
jgi:ABC-type nickel/cobalt efflux system permease component RcnA